MRQRNLLQLLFAASCLLVIPLISAAQVDIDASNKTIILYDNLKTIQNSNQFLFGQEFFNSFRYSSGGAHGDEEYADCFAVTGAYPVVLGSDFHYYLEKDATERSYHTEAVKWAYQQGFVITFDWHLSGKGTTTYEYTETTKDLVNNIVADPEGDDGQWYFGELDKVIDIINNDLVVDGERIPIVFRPLHEMNGGWFWWGSQATTPGNYKLMYALTVDYIKAQTNSVLFCWSPNTPTSFDHYPGDEYVDILGLDAYEINPTSFRQQIAPIVDHAQANDKVAVFSETGYRNDSGNGDQAAAYWNNTVLPAIVDDRSGNITKIAWVLTWINASWSEPYVPHASSSATARNNFIAFKDSPHVIFSDKAQNMYEPVVITSASEEVVASREDLTVYPVPARNEVTFRLHGFALPAWVRIVDLTGRVVYQRQATDEEFTLELGNLLQSGMYRVTASDPRKTIHRKLVIR